MTEQLKKYLNSDAQVKQQFLQYLDEGNLFDAYRLCRGHVYDKDIFELFTETECFENLNQSKNYWFVVYDLTFEKEEIIDIENSYGNKDPVVFNCMLDVLNELKPYKSYHKYNIEKISKNAAIKPFGKYYRLDCFVPDIQSRMSVFDEDNIVDAIRGALNRKWSENTSDMYDGNRDEDISSIQPAIDLINTLSQKYPLYYVTGNHEQLSEGLITGKYQNILDLLDELNITFLRNEYVEIERNGEIINLYGMDIPIDSKTAKYPSNWQLENDYVNLNPEAIQ